MEIENMREFFDRIFFRQQKIQTTNDREKKVGEKHFLDGGVGLLFLYQDF